MKVFGLLAAAHVFADEFEPCAEGEMDLGFGLCTSDTSVAEEVGQYLTELQSDEEDVTATYTRRFSIGSSSEFDQGDDLNLRTKRRTQRIALLTAKVSSTQEGKNLRPREFMRRINSYGCHCWTKPGTEHIGYKGVPLDGIDRSCRTLHSCHTCIELEYDRCDPVNTKYRAKIIRGENGEIAIQCTNTLNAKGTNNGDCKRSLCECDKQFSYQVAGAWNEWRDQNWSLDSKGLFDQACFNIAVSRTQSGPPNACCGSGYPDMKPFNTDTHQCVDAHVTPFNNL